MIFFLSASPRVEGVEDEPTEAQPQQKKEYHVLHPVGESLAMVTSRKTGEPESSDQIPVEIYPPSGLLHVDGRKDFLDKAEPSGIFFDFFVVPLRLL